MPTEGIVFKPEDFKVKSAVQHKSKAGGRERSGVLSSSSNSTLKRTKGKDKLESGAGDPLVEFYAEANAQEEHRSRAGVRP